MLKKITTSRFSILIIFSVLAVIGLALLPRLSVQWLPSYQSPSLTVRFSWPNASPEVVEQEVITPLEGAFNLVEGIQSIYSTAQNSGGNLRLEVEDNVHLDYLRFEIASKIRQLYPNLPQGVSFPEIYVNNPEKEVQDRPILTYSLSGNDAPAELYRYASEVLNPKLALTDGIQSINIQGGNRLEWRIYYDAAQLQTLNLRETDIQTALQQHLQEEAIGKALVQERLYTVRLTSESDALKGETSFPFANIPIKKVKNRLIYLSDIATVKRTEQPPVQYYRIKGQSSIRLLFYPEQGVNTLQLAKTIQQQLADLTPTLPPSYQLRLDDDATKHLAEELGKIGQRTLLSLGILLVFVVLAYRNWRYLWVVLLSLCANLGLAFIAYYFFAVELHLYALAGITVSFGIIIDNSIIMLHHIQHQGNLKVFPALLAATLTTIAALVIIWFLPKQWQANLAAFAEVIAINLGVSLLVAVFFIPALMQQIGLKPKSVSNQTVAYEKRYKLAQISNLYERLLQSLIRRKRIVILAVILLFGLPVFMLPNKIQDWEWYNKSLGNDYYIEHIKPTVNKLLGGTLRLFVWYVYEGASYRQPEETVLYVQGSMPPGSTLEQMNAVFQQIESYLSQFDTEVRQYTTQVSSGQFGMTTIYFNKGHELTFPYQLKNRLIAYSLNMGGVQWNVYGVGKGFSNESGSSPPRFRVMMYGYNKDELEQQAERFAEKLLAHPRIQEVNTEANINWWEKNLYEYELNLYRRQLAEQKAVPIQLRQVLTQFDQSTRPDWILANNEPVRLLSTSLPTKNLWTLLNESHHIDSTKILFTPTVSLQKQKVSSSINKENQQYIRLVEFEYTGSARFGSQYLEEVMQQMKKEMPLGYSMKQDGWEWNTESRKQYGLLLLVMILIFFICTITFESLRQAFAIIALIPTSFIGIFLTFYGFDFPFDQGGYTSFILLSGIVVNSLILIINDFNHFRKIHPKRSNLSIYIKAFHHKIVPILLTIFSTAVGLIPFLIHGQQEVFWFSLAVGTIGGLLFSILVILFFIPVFVVRS